MTRLLRLRRLRLEPLHLVQHIGVGAVDVAAALQRVLAVVGRAQVVAHALQHHAQALLLVVGRQQQPLNEGLALHHVLQLDGH